MQENRMIPDEAVIAMFIVMTIGIFWTGYGVNKKK